MVLLLSPAPALTRRYGQGWEPLVRLPARQHWRHSCWLAARLPLPAPVLLEPGVQFPLPSRAPVQFPLPALLARRAQASLQGLLPPHVRARQYPEPGRLPLLASFLLSGRFPDRGQEPLLAAALSAEPLIAGEYAPDAPLCAGDGRRASLHEPERAGDVPGRSPDARAYAVRASAVSSRSCFFPALLFPRIAKGDTDRP